MGEKAWETVSLKHDQAVAFVRINREKKLNALNTQVLDELYEVFCHLEQDKEIRVVVLSGTGDAAFAAGADLEEIGRTEEIADFEKYYKKFDQVYAKIASLPQPVIARVNGYAWGGGCLLALSCDLIVATRKSSFSQPEVNFGFTGGAALLPRLVGRQIASEIAFLGKPFGVEEAFRWNLINRIAEDESQLDTIIEQFVGTLLKKNLLTIAMIKRCIHNSYEVGITAAGRYETTVSTLCLSTDDSKQRISRFLQRDKSF